jgi:hypothetical protein
MTSRRDFMFRVLPATAALAGIGGLASAQAARLEESDQAAVALGYRHDASKVDAKKSPTYAAGRNCANCQLYTGKAGEAWGPCGAVGGKLVNAKGWCIAWAKKV